MEIATKLAPIGLALNNVGAWIEFNYPRFHKSS